MRRTLLVTNDFPPRVGGIERYLADYLSHLPAADITVLTHALPKYASEHYSAYPIHRHNSRILLPTPAVAADMTRIIREQHIETVWFGAAAPLGLLADAAREAGATRIIASTHGHEAGWMLSPPSRALLKRIFAGADVVTYISEYTKERLQDAVPAAVQLLRLPSGIDTARFKPDGDARLRLRARYHLQGAPTVVCVSRLVPRKGQDALIKAWPEVVARVPDARLMIVGWGSYAQRLAHLRRVSPARDSIILTGAVPEDELAGHVALGDVFAMPCRTRNFGADVEGLGIVFLEAAAVGLPVVAGDSGGAPETVLDGESGFVVDGHDTNEIADAIAKLLLDSDLRERMGAAGRGFMKAHWEWPALVASLHHAIDHR